MEPLKADAADYNYPLCYEAFLQVAQLLRSSSTVNAMAAK